MKKSTILLLVIVYIVSFFVIGLLGHSIRNYNPEVYPESVEIIDPDNRTEMSKDTVDPDTGELLYHYYFVYKNYKSGDSVRIKANIKTNFALITLTDELETVLSTPFFVSTTNPGSQIKLKVCITFVSPLLS